MAEKLFQNKWFLRILSVLLATGLFIYVRSTNVGVATTSPNGTTSVVSEAVIQGVPIYSNHNESTFVSGLPETVSVKVTGPRNIVQRMTRDDVQVVVDNISELSAGQHTVTLVAKGLPESVTAEVDPPTVTITVDRTVTLEKEIEVVTNAPSLGDAFVLGTPKADPQKVILRGSEAVMARVASVTVSVTVPEGQQENLVLRNQPVQVRDETGELLDVSVNYPEVTVTVPIMAYSTTVPVTYALQGDGASGYDYAITGQSRQTVTVTGSKAILDQLTSVTAVVNLANVTTTQTYPATVQLPQGVSLANAGAVTVTVTVTPKSNNGSGESNHQSSESSSSSQESSPESVSGNSTNADPNGAPTEQPNES